jgi:hypothetical protein
MSSLPLDWAPVGVDPFPPYDELVSENFLPSLSNDHAWQAKTVRPTLRGVADPQSIWKAILAIWRLRQVEKEGRDNPSWRTLLTEWLVRLFNDYWTRL